MNPEMTQALEECVFLANRLVMILNGENNTIGSCIRGNLMIEYKKSILSLEEYARSIQTRLIMFQQQQITAT